MMLDSYRHHSTSFSAAGFSIIEVVVGMAVMLLGSLGFLSLSVTSFTLEVENSELAMATAAARVMVEELQATPFAEVFATYNEQPGDDPEGPGTANGNHFTIQGSLLQLNAMITTTDTKASTTQTSVVDMTVDLRFPTLPNGTLSEAATPLFPGMPVDLNADGTISTGDRSGDYKVLPCLLVITWNTSRGARSLTIPKLLTRKRWQRAATLPTIP
jgi:Tfp pilus assembly protein PilV